MNVSVEIYHKLLPENKIMFFSNNDYCGDECLNHDIYHPVKMDDFLEAIEHIDSAEGKQSANKLLIMDDIGTLRNAPKKEKVMWLFIDTVLENMRKKNVSIYIITHVPTNFRQTQGQRVAPLHSLSKSTTK